MQLPKLDVAGSSPVARSWKFRGSNLFYSPESPRIPAIFSLGRQAVPGTPVTLHAALLLSVGPNETCAEIDLRTPGALPDRRWSFRIGDVGSRRGGGTPLLDVQSNDDMALGPAHAREVLRLMDDLLPGASRHPLLHTLLVGGIENDDLQTMTFIERAGVVGKNRCGRCKRRTKVCPPSGAIRFHAPVLEGGRSAGAGRGRCFYSR